MSETKRLKLRFEELCLAAELPQEMVVEIIEQGIIEPYGDTPAQWVFTTHMLAQTKKAVRLHRDLNIDWPGIALAILEQLREENTLLKQRLSRFTRC